MKEWKCNESNGITNDTEDDGHCFIRGKDNVPDNAERHNNYTRRAGIMSDIKRVSQNRNITRTISTTETALNVLLLNFQTLGIETLSSNSILNHGL